MADRLFAGDWECFAGKEDIEKEDIPTIICRPKNNRNDPYFKFIKKDAPYFKFIKDKVILENTNQMSIVPDNINKRMVFKR